MIPSMNKLELDRRAFCELAGLALVTMALPACGPDGAGAPMCGAGSVSAGPASAIAVGMVKQIDRVAFDTLFVCRDSAGLYAISGACTHMRCSVKFVSQAKGFDCSCHNSSFDFNGENPNPPATTALPHLMMCIDASGNLIVDPEQTVAANIRYQA